MKLWSLNARNPGQSGRPLLIKIKDFRYPEIGQIRAVRVRLTLFF